VTRLARTTAALLLVFPASAYAHGEQLLLMPAAALFLLLCGAAVISLRWRVGWRVKALLLSMVVVTHGALWFLPLRIQSWTGLIVTFLGMIAAPLIVGECAYALLRCPKVNPR
jgi:hypothetical protein